MLELALPLVLPAVAPTTLRQKPAILRQADVSAPSWYYGDVGTGGQYVIDLVQYPVGYAFPGTRTSLPFADKTEPYAQQMQQVREGFGRNMSRLTEVFGVSRQTLYNWLNGETPKDIHAQRLRELSLAAAVFSEMGFKPNATALDRPLMQGKSFLQLMAQGANGQEMAKKLIRVHQRSENARAKLDAMLAGQKPRLTAEDFGAPALNEDV